MSRGVFWSAVALTIVAQCLATAAQAQTDPAAQPSPAARQAGSGAEGEGEIIVTARKRSERLLDVPAAVTAVGEEKIERYAINSLSAIAQQVPQLVIAESQNQVGGSINLRGIGAGVSNPSTEQSVTLNLDGVPISYGNAVRLGDLDLQRVEVLKGPQALFYGKNSPGGIISLISQDPKDVLEAQLRAGYEFEADQRFLEAIISGPVTDTIGARLVVYYSKEDGYFRNVGIPVAGRTPGIAAKSNNAEDVFVRGTVNFKSPDGRFHLKTKVNYGQRERVGVGAASLAQIRVCPFGVSQVSHRAEDCGLDRTFSDVITRPEVAALNPNLHGGVPFANSKQFLGSVTADYDIGDKLTLTSVTGYYKLHEDSFDSFTFVTVPQVSATNDLHIRSLSEEVRLASNYDGPLNFLVGGFYQKGKFTVAQVVPIDFGGACPSATCFLSASTFYDQRTTASSIFGQLRYKITDQIELAAGARQSWERKSIIGSNFGIPFVIGSPRKHYHDFSPEVTLTYKPNSDLTFYAAYREGFTSGGFNTVASAVPAGRDLSFGQTTVRGGELGIKGYLADRQIMFDLVGYYYKYKGLQLTHFDTVQIAQLTQNAGGAKVRGIEFNTTVHPRAAPGFELRGSAAYNKATYSPFIGACYPGQSVVAGCNLVPAQVTSATDIAAGRFAFTTPNPANPASLLYWRYTSQNQTGQQIARAPKWTLNGGFSYDHQLGANVGGTISFDVTYTSSYQTQIEAQPEARQPGYWTLNGNLTLYGGKDRAWQVALIGRNLTNKIVAISGGAVAFVGTGTGTPVATPADLYGSVSLPRQVLLQVTLKNTLFGK